MGMGSSAIRPRFHGKVGLGMGVSCFPGRAYTEGVFVAVVLDPVFLPFPGDQSLPFDYLQGSVTRLP